MSPSIRPRGVIVYADIAGSAVLGHIGLHGHHHRRPPPSPQPREHLPVRGDQQHTVGAAGHLPLQQVPLCSSASFSGSASAPAAPHSGPWPPAPCPAGWPDQVPLSVRRITEISPAPAGPAGDAGSVASSINSTQSPRRHHQLQITLCFIALSLLPVAAGPPLHPAPAGGSARWCRRPVR